jgi:hypothetical protein
MSSFVKALDAEIADLERELEGNPTYMKLCEAKRLRAVYTKSEPAPRPATRPAPATSRPFSSGAGAAILSAIRDFIADKREPTPTRDLMEWLEVSGVEVGGANPQNVVSSMLSKSPEFISHGRSGWTLAVPEGRETEKADDLTLPGMQSSAPIENRPSQPVELQAKGREAVPGGGT